MLRATRRPGPGTLSLDGSQASTAEFPDDRESAPEVEFVPVQLSGAVEASVTEPLDGPVAAQGPSAVAHQFVPAPAPMSAPAPASIRTRSWQPARQGSRDRAPVREAPVVDPNAEPAPPGIERVATAPQLRRFIKSRAYVPMHELRRRFGINGGDDDVTQVALERSHIYVGLPEREGQLLGELLRGGDIGYELSLDPISPIVVGVYPMRPVTRG